jgi:hypothetical protein
MPFPTVRALGCLAALLGASLASAKLPAPSPEAAAKAQEASAKAAWAGKVDNYKLCLAQDRAAAAYRRTAKEAKPAVATPACADPGPFVYTPPEPKPAEAAPTPKS